MRESEDTLRAGLFDITSAVLPGRRAEGTASFESFSHCCRTGTEVNEGALN